MSIKYHINPETKKPNRCKAEKKPCRFGEGTEHFSTIAEARRGVEERLAAEMGGSATPLRKPQKPAEQPETQLDSPTPTEEDLSRQRAIQREEKRKFRSRLRYADTVVNKDGRKNIRKIISNNNDENERTRILQMSDDALIAYLEGSQR